MKHGHVECRDIKALIFGSAGTGKTHTIALIMEEDPPTVRRSTPCAKRPVRAVSRARIERKGKKWVRVDHDNLSQKIVDESTMLASSLVPGTSPAASSSTMTTAGGFEAGASSPTKAVLTSSTDDASGSSILHKKLSSTPSIQTVEELLQCIEESPYGKYTRMAFEQDRISLIDTGGQPQFHEVLPIFMQYASASMFVMKLSDRLSDHPVIEFYDDNGCLVGKAYHSAYTNQQILMQYMRVMQSQASQGFCPMSFYIGTHKDLEHQCAETRKEKNLKLLEILLPAVHSNTFFYDEKTEEPIFPLNVKTPGPEEHQIAEELRRLIVEKSCVKPRPIPLRWHALELALQKLMLELKRGVLSKAECFEVARRYHFDTESFEEALRYLHKLNILFYYEDVLPDVIFCDPQVLLDKITELVEHSYRLKTDPSKGTPIEGNIWKFRDQGIVTLEFLNKPCFTKHYVSGLFGPVELLNLFKKLLIVSQITEEEYLMPSLLPLADEPSLLSPSGSVPSLLFYFPESSLLGVFCGLIAYLLSQGEWKLLPKADSQSPGPAKVDRNTVHFEVPGGLPGKVILTDSFSTYFQVDIQIPPNAPSDMCSEVCPEIQATIMKGIRMASKNLHYNNSIPKLSFLCYEHSSTNKQTPHATVVNSSHKLMKCTVNAEVCSIMTADHQVWFGASSATACGKCVMDYNIVGASSCDVIVYWCCMPRSADP